MGLHATLRLDQQNCVILDCMGVPNIYFRCGKFVCLYRVSQIKVTMGISETLRDTILVK